VVGHVPRALLGLGSRVALLQDPLRVVWKRALTFVQPAQQVAMRLALSRSWHLLVSARLLCGTHEVLNVPARVPLRLFI
jgi:hypothetical protein